jgi:L,D-transpeptidase catalytic domain
MTKKIFMLLVLWGNFALAYDENVLIQAAQKSGVPQNQISKVTGYMAKHAASIPNKNYVTFVDFSLPSTERRGYLINTNTGATQSFLVSHGNKSGGLYAEQFSNVIGSNKSSLGLYFVKKTYFGDNGYSVRLAGLEASNSNVEARTIVIHPADYVSDQFIKNNGMLGRSEGCFALDRAISKSLIDKVKDGSLWSAYN